MCDNRGCQCKSALDVGHFLERLLLELEGNASLHDLIATTKIAYDKMIVHVTSFIATNRGHACTPGENWCNPTGMAIYFPSLDAMGTSNMNFYAYQWIADTDSWEIFLRALYNF
jgi:hypothetical protein